MTTDVIDNYIQLGLLVIAVSSIFSPVIVTILNNRHNYKIIKLEYTNKIKQEVLTNFSKSVSNLFGRNYFHKEFHEALNLLYIYFNVDDTLVNKILSNDYKDMYQYQNDVTKLMKYLGKQVNK